jgi:phosphoglycerol transferase
MASASPDSARKRWQGAGYYGVVCLVAAVLGLWVLGLAGNLTSVPITYSDDGIAASVGIKGIIENGHSFGNAWLGAPDAAEYFDFPNADGAMVALIWLISRFIRDYVTVLNVFALLTYPLIAAAAAWSLRRLGISGPVAAVCALLYAMLPFHQSRVTFHLFLSAYFVVPLVIALVAEVVMRPSAGAASERRFLGLPLWAWGVVLLMGMCGMYYAFFGLVLVVLAGIVTAYRDRTWRALLPALAVVLGVVLLLALQMAPSYAYWAREGRNNTGDMRQPVESDFFGLRLTQLVYPMDGHRIERFANAKQYLHDSFEMITPDMAYIAYDSSLGLVGVIGLLVLGFWALAAPFRAPPDGADGAPGKLAFVGVSSFLLGTVGGVGSLIAFVAFPQIRAYDRVTVYVAFASIGAVAWVVDALMARQAKSGRTGASRAAAVIVLAMLLAVGVLDQTNPAVVGPDYREISAVFDSDAEFVADVEAALPDDALVFQLPYVTYPEGPAPEGTGVYDPLRLYLHSATIHWSAGAFARREAALWQAEMAELDPGFMLADLADEGFAGLTIDRRGYEDGGRELEGELALALDGNESIESPDGRYVFFALAK